MVGVHHRGVDFARRHSSRIAGGVVCRIGKRSIKAGSTVLFRPGYPPPALLYFQDMSTSTISPGISADEFQALEQKVLRAVEIVKREREARAAAEAEVATLREQLALQLSNQSEAQATAQAQLEAQVDTLNQERDAVRQRVEKMLQQMDELL